MIKFTPWNNFEIYTGYAWRPLKEEEFEILTSDRVYLEKYNDPKAGDVFKKDDSTSLRKYYKNIKEMGEN